MITIYLKKCQHCNLLYLGKTTKDPFKYKGSGKHWLRHIKKHNSVLTTTILFQSCDTNIIKEQGLKYSKQFDVVHNPLFANLREESGDGGDTSSFIDYKKMSVNRKKAWKNPSGERVKDIENRKTFDYKLKQNKTKQIIHTPFGVYPSMSETIKILRIGDFNCLKSWLSGKTITTGMVNALKNNFFTLDDVGKNTNDLGWYYEPI